MKYLLEELEIRVARPMWLGPALQVWLLQHSAGAPQDRIVSRVTGFEAEVIGEGSIIEPTCRITDQRAQELVDGLWEAGIRPSQAKGSAGQLDAVNQHLGDMRAIVSYALEVDLRERKR